MNRKLDTEILFVHLNIFSGIKNQQDKQGFANKYCCPMVESATTLGSESSVSRGNQTGQAAADKCAVTVVCSGWDTNIRGLVGVWCLGMEVRTELVCEKYLLSCRLFTNTLDDLFQGMNSL